MRALRPVAVAVVVAVLSRCSERRPPGGAAETELKPPEVELPEGVRPKHYSATLSIDPTKETFTGKITIDVETKSPTKVIWLHGRRLQVARATVKSGSESIAARVLTPTKMLI